MFGFVTSTFIGALLAAIGLKYEAPSVLILVLMANCLAFITHGENIPVIIRSGAWFLELALGLAAVINAIAVLL